MSDSSPHSRGSSPELPPATIYDPADDQDTPFGAEPTGTVVLLLVGDVDRRWAAESAVELSTAWARNGRRIVLADLFFENPQLHEAAGADNLEGVVDVFLYGASISRSARPVKGRGFYLIPSGTYTADFEAIYRHPRWPKLVAGFRDASASLLLFAPADAADLEALAPWVSQVVLLGTPRDRGVLTPLQGAEIRGRIVPPSPATASASEEIVVPTPVLAPVVEPPVVEPPVVEPPAPDPELHLPPPPVRPTRRPRRLVTAALWLLAIVGVLGAAGYLVAALKPELLPAWARVDPGTVRSRVGARRDTASITPPRVLTSRPAPVPQAPALPYSVQVINYRSLTAARRQLTRVQRRNEGMLFFISPEEIDGILYYKILAGALPDSAAARGLKERLVQRGTILEEDAADAGALIQPTPLSFDLGEMGTEETARSAADSLLARRIPAYTLAVPYSDSSRRWQVYGGAFRDSTAAEGFRKLLSTAGLTPRLVPRTGQVAGAPE